MTKSLHIRTYNLRTCQAKFFYLDTLNKNLFRLAFQVLILSHEDRQIKSKNVYKSKKINSSQSNENDPEINKVLAALQYSFTHIAIS